MDKNIKNSKILIVDDEVEILNLLKMVLLKEGFEEIYTAESGKRAINLYEEINPDVAILDVMLPDMEGYDICKTIRKTSNMPIMFLSAKGEELDRIMGLAIGADDYITKPFYYDVVIAKIKSYIRRTYGEYSPKLDERIVELDGLKFYPERLELKYKSKDLVLTKKEGILLECLMKKYPKVVSRDYLLEKIWDDIEFVEENTLNVNVSRIRKRLYDLGIEDGVQTVRGVGYKLNKTW